MTRWLRRSRDERGAVLVVVAIAMTALIGSTALAVDIGRVTVLNRHLEAAADVVALDTTRAIDTSQTVSELLAPTGAVTLAVQASAARNNVPSSDLTVALGTMDGDAFQPGNADDYPDTVQVIASGQLKFAFAPGFGGGDKSSSGDGSGTTTTTGGGPPTTTPPTTTPCQGVCPPPPCQGLCPPPCQGVCPPTCLGLLCPIPAGKCKGSCVKLESIAGFSIGSFLVGTTGADDTVLNAIFGDSFHAQVVSYQGLAAANVTTSLKKLGLNMPVTVMSPTQLLNTSVSAKNLMLASAAALNDGNHAAAVNVLNALATSVSTTTMVRLGDTIKVEAGGEKAAADAEMNVLQMLTAAAFVVDGTHAITIPQAQVNVPGIGNVTLTLDVITPAQTAFGPVGTTASNTQVHLTITPQVHVTTAPSVNACSLRSTLGALLSLNVAEILTCGVLNTGIVNKVITLDLDASIPIDLSAAGASATLSNIACPSAASITLSPTINPLTVNSNIDMTFTGTLVGNSLGNVLRVRANAGLVSQSTPSAQVFLNPSEFGTPRTVTSNTLGLAGVTNLTASNATLLDVDLGPVSSILAAAAVIPVNAAFSALDTSLITPLVHRLGLGIGGADLTALTGSLRCKQIRIAG